MRRNFPRPYTTTYLLVLMGQLVTHAESELTIALRLYLRVEIPSFPLLTIALGLFRCRFSSCSARAFAPVSLALLPCSINS